MIGLLPKSPVIVCDLLKSYDSYDSEIGRFMSLVPSLNDDDDKDDDKANGKKGATALKKET